VVSNEEVELELELLHQTDDAYLLSDGDTEAWVPRSLVSSLEEGDDEDTVIVTIPEWLAKEKGLV